MKTLAELKREAKSGILEGKFIHHSQFGANLPKRLQGWRKLIDSNSVAIYFLTSDGKKSELRLDKASLVDYDGQTLTIFNAGYRDLTEEEKYVMNVWKEKSSTSQFKAQEELDALSDGSSTYWAKVFYFRKVGYEYLMGFNKQRGMKYDTIMGKVQDDKIKGTICMQYQIRRVA
ncbi:MAG: hypothetical protein HFE32_00600 [Clostridia bacterium]|uniref:hypothetical protein n=1 Tax=Bacteroides acidifaciens TaxID=85831 RepID=UPI002557F40A|nr:hypothetical protein [Bacteroides acidifaciens]MCI9290285.1 hypothetical protein [Clostridia bacterium]